MPALFLSEMVINNETHVFRKHFCNADSLNQELVSSISLKNYLVEDSEGLTLLPSKMPVL